MREYEWARLLAYVTGLVNQELLLLQYEYLAADDRILRTHLPTACGCQIQSAPHGLRSPNGLGARL